MRRIRGVLIVSLLAGLATLTVAAPAGGPAPGKKAAQDTVKKATVKPTSAKRIRVVKESKGEVMVTQQAKPVIDEAACAEHEAQMARDAQIAREQAATAARLDQQRLDSVIAAQAFADFSAQIAESRRLANEWAEQLRLTKANAAAAEYANQMAIQRRTARGFYVGLAGGATMPQRNVRNGYTGGWNTTIPVGWDAKELPFGVRADFSVDHLNGTLFKNSSNVLTSASGDITVWSLNLGAKARMHVLGPTSRTHLYVLGGVGAHRVAEGVYGSTGPMAGQNMSFGDAKTRLGWNAGAGASIGLGRNELFIESRFFQVKTDLPYMMNGGLGTYTSFTPIVVGFTWF